MKFWPLAAAALIAAETAAIACSCLTTDDPAELRRLAGETAKDAVAMVEAETILAYQDSNGAGDRMRIVRGIAGQMPAGEFRVARGDFPSSASCDQLYDRGQRALLLLYPAPGATGGEPVYRISGLCTAGLLDKPVFRDEVARLMAGASGLGERG